MNDSAIPSSIAKLLAGVCSHEPAVVEQAGAQLATLGEPAVPWVIAALKARRGTTCRINLGKALGKLGRVAWNPLLEAAQNSDNEDFGWSVAWALQNFVDVCSVDDFLLALRHPNVHVRWATALSLGQFADERVVNALIAALAEDGPEAPRDPDEFVPQNYYRKIAVCAAKSLHRIGPVAVPALLSALQSDNPLVRTGAATALTGGEDLRAVEPLLEASRDPDASVRRHAIEAIASLVAAPGFERQREACDACIEALQEPDQHTQIAAAKGLCELGDLAVTPLINLVEDRHWDMERPYTRTYAVRALGCLLSKDPPIPELAQRLLPLLTSVLREQANPSWLRQETASALGKTKDVHAVESLMMALADSDPYIRQAVAKALQTLGDKRALSTLQEALQVAREEPEPVETDAAVEDLCWLLEEAIAALNASSEEDEK